MKKRYFIAAFLFMSGPAFSQGLPLSSSSSAPIEITAAHSLEWNRKDKTYTAHEHAQATQGDRQLTGDTLTAYYTGDKGATDIKQMVALGHVTVKSPPYTAYGDKAVYDVATGHATLTGQALRIETPTEHLTARDKIEFFGSQNRLTATGNAVAVRGADTLKADVLDGYFTKDAAGKTAMNKAAAEGHVTIITEKETLTGDHGVYDIPAQKAVLTGKVRLLQGSNWLEGDRATVDLKTGISQLFADGAAAATEGRVKGVFYPKSQTP